MALAHKGSTFQEELIGPPPGADDEPTGLSVKLAVHITHVHTRVAEFDADT